MSKTVFLTGAGGGFGKLIAKTLLDAGHRVAGTMRDLKGRNAAVAQELEALGARIVEMDVTNEKSVNDAVATVEKENGGIDVVINNAGVGVLGLTETFTPEDMQRIFDINVFGVQRVNRAALPAMRKRGDGLILFISSILGRMTVPYYGPYNASKWALEALAENYRTELSGFGVDAAIIEPGGFATAFIENLVRPGDTQRNDTYGSMPETAEEFLKGFEGALASNPEQDPQNVADAVLNVIATEPGKRPFRTIVDNMGMGAAIEPYNENLHQLTAGIYGNFGLSPMLEIKGTTPLG
jgi:NAD(P)-dependent dehydrogenase (short-subunit alcohol dehydrogenase family)